MGSNVFFNNYNNVSEQTLHEDLIIEAISIYGHTVYYCPRTLGNKDDIYGEDAISEYNSSYPLDVYVKSYDSYEGDGTFLSKFNLEIRDQIKFTIAKRTFDLEIGAPEEILRPREGDLIYSEMMKRLFVIMYVNDKAIFYQLGNLPIYDITCEVFEYSSERLNTGILEIDKIENDYSVDEDSSGILTNKDEILVDEDGLSITIGQFNYEEQNKDKYSDNEEFIDESQGIVEWSEENPFGEA